MGTSVLCVGIDQGLAWLLRDVLLAHMGIDYTGLIWASGLLARLVSSVVNFALNRSFVFKLKGSAKSAVWKYALLCVAVICISNLCVQLLELIGWNAGIAKAVCDTLPVLLQLSHSEPLGVPGGRKESMKKRLQNVLLTLLTLAMLLGVAVSVPQGNITEEAQAATVTKAPRTRTMNMPFCLMSKKEDA